MLESFQRKTLRLVFPGHPGKGASGSQGEARVGSAAELFQVGMRQLNWVEVTTQHNAPSIGGSFEYLEPLPGRRSTPGLGREDAEMCAWRSLRAGKLPLVPRGAD